MENPVHGWAKRFKTYSLVFLVILEVGKLGLLCQFGIDCESIRCPCRDFKHINLRPLVTMRGKLYMFIELTGEGYGVVIAVCNDIVAEEAQRPPPKKKSFQHRAVKLIVL